MPQQAEKYLTGFWHRLLQYILVNKVHEAPR